MKVLIAIPSKGRANTIFNRTMRWVPRTGFEYRVFVEPQEIEAYREGAFLANEEHYLDIDERKNIVNIRKNDRGLGYALKFIKKYAKKNGYDLVFKMDDDVMRFSGLGKNKPDGEMIIEFATMVARCRYTFGRYKDVAAVGFPYRGELYPGKVKEWSAINARLQTCYIIKTKYLIGDFDVMEDFAQYINIRAQNKVTLRYGLLGIDAADVGKNKGGHQLFDRGKKVEEEMPKLQKLYPAIEFKRVEGKSWQYEPVLKGEFYGVKNL